MQIYVKYIVYRVCVSWEPANRPQIQQHEIVQWEKMSKAREFDSGDFHWIELARSIQPNHILSLVLSIS